MSINQTDLTRFRHEMLQDLKDAILTDDSGGIREERFTQLALEYLEEAGETEGAIPCREIRESSIGKRIHKINGYALSEGYETIDLFITIFKGSADITRLYSDDLKTAASLATRFLQHLLSGKMEGIEETAPVFDFVNTIRKIHKDVVRANIYILSDMQIPLDPPEPAEINDIPVHYHIRDIEYLHRLHTSGTGQQSILIDFEQKFGEAIPCLPMPEGNEHYSAYLAVIPGRILADIYKDYGARLLEQNVRTFLQFRGDVNKGIRTTIIEEPHMFMAYNNGISATAASVELTTDGKAIKSIRDFQIVNGGQTTASIFQTRRKHKSLALDGVFVQIKLTVIRDQLKKSEIVSSISRYANTQTKVSEADFSTNHPFHIELEQLSRKTWTLANSGKNQTRWFYERARGQYNDELSQIDKPTQQKKWLGKNPKNQKFAKEDLARFYMSWEMGPWWVVRGRQKSFIEFMKIADKLDTGQVFYEDLIAKAIIFRTAERLYGAGAKAMGDLRFMVVPYTIAWLRFKTDGNINLFKIWKNQRLTAEFEKLLYSLLKEIDLFMRATAPGGLISEWAKKEECWLTLKKYDLGIDISALKQELYTPAEMNERYQHNTMDPVQKELLRKRIDAVSADEWINIALWGKATDRLSILESNTLMKIARKIENKKELTDKELLAADSILKTAEEGNYFQVEKKF